MLTHKRFLLILLFVCLCGSPAAAEEGVRLSLEDALALALRQNPGVRLSLEEVTRSRAALAEARSALLPSLKSTASFTDTRALYAKDVRSLKADVGLSQVLFAGGRIVKTIALAREGVVIAEAQLEGARLESALLTRKAFFTGLLAQKLQTLNAHILENTAAHVSLERARYDAGESSHSDVLRIERSLAAVRAACESSRNQERAAQAALQTVLGLQPQVIVVADGQMTYEEKELAFDEALLEALRSRPEIRQFEAQEKQAAASVVVAKAATRPQITAAWDYYSSSTPVTATSSARAWHDYQVAGITVSWPLFDGWAAKNKVDQALAGLSQSKLLRQKAALDIALEVQTAFLQLRNAIAGIRAAEAEAVLYGDAVAVSAQKYKSGEVSALADDDARLRYEVAQYNRDQALYEYAVAKAAFEKATGGI